MATIQNYDYYKTLATPSQMIEGRATASNAVATVPAPPAGEYAGGAIYITAIEFSGSAAPTAAVEATLTGLPGGATKHWEIANLAFAPIFLGFGTHPLQCAPNTAAVLTLPSLGASVIGTATIYYYYAP